MSGLDADPRAALAAAAASFARCRAEPSVHDVAFAGRHLRIAAVGAQMSDVVTSAFTPAAWREPDLTICAWDALAAPLAPPEPGRTAPIRVGRHYARDEAGRHIFWEPPWIYGFDPTTRVAFFHCPDAHSLPSWTRSQPLLRLLHAWLREVGDASDLVHGAVIGRDGVGLLLAGPGGSGKSTLAVAAALAGWTYLGDDYVALAGQRAFGLYGIAKLVPEHLARHLPAARAHTMDAVEGPKTLLRLPLSPCPAGLPIRAIVIPSVSDHDALTPLSPGRALLALAPSTLLQLPGGEATDRAALSRLAALTRALPTWSLSLGRDASATLALLARQLPHLTGTR